MTHASFAMVSGFLVGAIWFLTHPIPITQAENAVAGFIIGIVMYLLFSAIGEI